MGLQPRWSVVDRFLGRAVEGQVLRTPRTTGRGDRRLEPRDGWCPVCRSDRGEGPLPKRVQIVHHRKEGDLVALPLTSVAWWRRRLLVRAMPGTQPGLNAQIHHDLTSR